tara:strand:+ start:219 stop:1046 length:828 start_codon:yes stop_codon:yes gene_type:complete
MSSLFSGEVSIDIPVGRKPERARGKFRRMAGEIVKAKEESPASVAGTDYMDFLKSGIGSSSPTVGLAVEPRDKGEFERMIPRVGINPPSDDEKTKQYFKDKEKRQKEQSLINREKYPEGYGGMIDMPIGTGTTTQVIDKDGDGIDDRYQSGPGQDDYRGGIFSREERDKRRAERELERKERESKEKKKPLPNIIDRGKGRKRKKAVDNAVSFSRRIENRSEEDRSRRSRRSRRRKEGGNIPSDEQQSASVAGTDYMAFLTSGKATVPKFGKFELQ